MAVLPKKLYVLLNFYKKSAFENKYLLQKSSHVVNTLTNNRNKKQKVRLNSRTFRISFEKKSFN